MTSQVFFADTNQIIEKLFFKKIKIHSNFISESNRKKDSNQFRAEEVDFGTGVSLWILQNSQKHLLLQNTPDGYLFSYNEKFDLTFVPYKTNV